MNTASSRSPRSMDRRTKHLHSDESIGLTAFLEGEWSRALARNGRRGAADAKRLGLTPLTIEVEGWRKP